MTDQIFRPNRRLVLAGLGAIACRAQAAIAREIETQQPAPRAPLILRGQPDTLVLRREEKAVTPIWSIGGVRLPLRFARGDDLQIVLTNDLPVPIVLNWRGLEGNAEAEPLLGKPPLAWSATAPIGVHLRHAGTYLCDMALLGDGTARPSRALPLIVRETETVAVDRDETFLIEGWRIRADGSAIAPGVDPANTTPVYTVNGETGLDLEVRARQRLRLRFINGLARQVIALKIERHDVTVMALDGQPAEPFLARNGAFALAPGGRADVFVDVAPDAGSTPILMHDGETARPIAQLVVSNEAPVRSATLPAPTALPSNGLPAKLELKGALRVDLPFGGDAKDWLPPAMFTAATAPAFRAKPGRTVVMSLINRASTTSVFHLHGHHFRHLDRLDDGWKPFWLDTIAIDAGQTQRIAFAAEYAGRWLLEAAEARWNAPKLVRWFSVD
jgi:FtsP/CotA-like multicopper oxidase with cupredoxin domain